jgi:hypothetical protein
VATVFAVDTVYRVHQTSVSLAVDMGDQALLPLSVGHDVREEDIRLVVDEPRPVDALEQRLRRLDYRLCV